MRAFELMENKLDLSGFISGDLRNSYVNFQGLKVYLRKGSLYIDKEYKNVIQLANVTNPKRSSNIEINPRRKSTGKFKALINELNRLAQEYNYDGIYVESVLNDFLPDVLERYGFKMVNVQLGAPNYWREVI